MKDDQGYRFNISFKGRTTEEKRAGDFLNSLGRRKSSVIVTAVNEYIDRYCSEDSEAPQIQITTFSLSDLEDRIRTIIEERYGNLVPATSLPESSTPDTNEIQQGIVDMLNDLELFNI